jgi:hypothetical protein
MPRTPYQNEGVPLSLLIRTRGRRRGTLTAHSLSERGGAVVAPYQNEGVAARSRRAPLIRTRGCRHCLLSERGDRGEANTKGFGGVLDEVGGQTCIVALVLGFFTTILQSATSDVVTAWPAVAMTRGCLFERTQNCVPNSGGPQGDRKGGTRKRSTPCGRSLWDEAAVAREAASVWRPPRAVNCRAGNNPTHGWFRPPRLLSAEGVGSSPTEVETDALVREAVHPPWCALKFPSGEG